DLDDGPEPALDHRVVERLLAREVVVEARRRDAHLGGEVAHRDAVHTARREQPLGGVEDDGAGRGRRGGCRGRRATLPSDGGGGHGGVNNERTFVPSSGDYAVLDTCAGMG